MRVREARAPPTTDSAPDLRRLLRAAAEEGVGAGAPVAVSKRSYRPPVISPDRARASEGTTRYAKGIERLSSPPASARQSECGLGEDTALARAVNGTREWVARCARKRDWLFLKMGFLGRRADFSWSAQPILYPSRVDTSVHRRKTGNPATAVFSGALCELRQLEIWMRFVESGFRPFDLESRQLKQKSSLASSQIKKKCHPVGFDLPVRCQLPRIGTCFQWARHQIGN